MAFDCTLLLEKTTCWPSHRMTVVRERPFPCSLCVRRVSRCRIGCFLPPQLTIDYVYGIGSPCCPGRAPYGRIEISINLPTGYRPDISVGTLSRSLHHHLPALRCTLDGEDPILAPIPRVRLVGDNTPDRKSNDWSTPSIREHGRSLSALP